jgi:hypothetical protein
MTKRKATARATALRPSLSNPHKGFLSGAREAAGRIIGSSSEGGRTFVLLWRDGAIFALPSADRFRRRPGTGRMPRPG